MPDLRPLIDAYPALTPEERADVEARVAEAPEWADALAEAQRFAALLDAAGPAPPELPAPTPASSTPADVEDPFDKFERLTGRPVPDLHRPAPPEADPVLPDHPEGRPPPRAGRWTVGVIGGLVAAGAGLLALSGAATPERERVADLGALDNVAPRVVAQAGSGAAPLATRLASALNRAAASRHARLGRPAAYDEEVLGTAVANLERIVAEAETGSVVAEEGQMARGRILLYLGREAEAARALGALVRKGGYRAPEARRLLDYVRAGGAG